MAHQFLEPGTVRSVVVAAPLESVVLMVACGPLANIPLAPLPAAVSVRVVPATRTALPCTSSTVVLSSVPRLAPTVPPWLPPPLTTCDATTTLASAEVDVVNPDDVSSH